MKRSTDRILTATAVRRRMSLSCQDEKAASPTMRRHSSVLQALRKSWLQADSGVDVVSDSLADRLCNYVRNRLNGLEG
jgi:hypothetical protein